MLRRVQLSFLRQRFHHIVIAVLAIVLLWVAFNNSYWKKSGIIVWDVYGYTQYLSAGFIYGHISNPVELRAIDSIYRPTNGSYGYGRHCVPPDCKSLAFKYTMGNAVMMSPFYMVAHGITKVTKNFPANGYSQPYQFAVAISTLFWAICGLIVLSILLRRWFSPVVTGITLVMIVLGTNYLYYAALGCGMTHIPTFFCIATALLSMFLWLEKKSWRYAFLFGTTTGLIALIRLPDLVFGIIPVVLFVKAFYESDGRGHKLLLAQAVLAAFVIALVFFPQMGYCKYVSGNWFHYSYVDEKFYFNDPHIIDGLFSYKKGWLLYTPVMIFAVAGIFVVIRKMRWIGIAILLFVIVNVYVVFSWQTWWYGGSFGARSMIQSYAVLAIPLAFVIQWIRVGVLRKKKFLRLPAILLSLLLLFFLSLNLFQTFQYKRGVIHYENMNKEAYWSIFAKTEISAEEFNRLYN
jgi:hypothetical protein